MTGGRVSGRVALVTGGSMGIGEAVVRHLAAEGASVVFCARGEELGRDVESSLRAVGEVTFLPCDVTAEAQVDALVADTVDRYGHLDVVVTNAGGGAADPWPDEPTEHWHETLALNLDGMRFVCRAAWPHLVASGHASVVAVTSLSAWMAVGRDQLDAMGGFQPAPSYQAAKAAMEGLVVHLAGRGGEHGVRVNGVRPGRILTDKFRNWLGEDGVFWSHYRQAQLLKRHGEVDDVAHAVLFYASDESSFVTGTFLDVNGGAVVKL